MKKLSVFVIFILMLVLSAHSSYAQNTYENQVFDYSFNLPDTVRSSIIKVVDNADEGTVTLSDDNGYFSAVVNCDKVDESVITAMRAYLEDYKSSDSTIFDKVAEYKDSYFFAMLNSYKKDFLIGSGENSTKEANIKIFEHYSEKVAGVISYVVLYNEIQSEDEFSREATHINISIPVSANKTIYNINFTIKRGYLDDEMLTLMSDIVSSMRILSLPEQRNNLLVFSDKKSIDAANLGIYPNLRDISIENETYINSKAGYSITYPSTFIPYLTNSVTADYDYKSFKINYNHCISIIMLPSNIGYEIVEERINELKEQQKDGVNITAEGIQKYKQKDLRYIKYNVTDKDNHSTYIQDFYLEDEDGRIYQIQLNSRFIRPSFVIESSFMDIVYSFKFINKTKSNVPANESFTKFLNKADGYSFEYPSAWAASENISNDINYDCYTVKNADYSGPTDIVVAAGELITPLSIHDIKKLGNSSSISEFDKYFKKYSAPYSGLPAKSLSSCYTVNKDCIYFYRLINYIDANERLRLCYTIDIVREKKVVSLFIATGEYITSRGSIVDSDIQQAIDLISSSFKTENTDEYKERQLMDELRNNKVVMIENYFRSLLGYNASVISAAYGKSKDTAIVQIGNTAQDGFYLLSIDSANSTYRVLQRLLISNLSNDAITELKDKYKDVLIDEVAFYEDDMTVDIEYREEKHSSPVRKTYYIRAFIKDGLLGWELERKY